MQAGSVFEPSSKYLMLLPGKPRVEPAIAADLAGDGDEIIEPIVAVET